MNIVVTGYRHWDEPDKVTNLLESWLKISGYTLHVGVGDCPTGADKFTRDWCRDHHVPCTVYRADWDRYKRAAGPIRNKAMIDEMDPLAVLAFLHPESRGTKQCAEYAAEKGIPVIETQAVRKDP